MFKVLQTLARLFGIQHLLVTNVYIPLLDINLDIHLGETTTYVHEKAGTLVHSSTLLNKVKKETIQRFITAE